MRGNNILRNLTSFVHRVAIKTSGKKKKYKIVPTLQEKKKRVQLYCPPISVRAIVFGTPPHRKK